MLLQGSKLRQGLGYMVMVIYVWPVQTQRNSKAAQTTSWPESAHHALSNPAHRSETRLHPEIPSHVNPCVRPSALLFL